MSFGFGSIIFLSELPSRTQDPITSQTAILCSKIKFKRSEYSFEKGLLKTAKSSFQKLFVPCGKKMELYGAYTNRI